MSEIPSKLLEAAQKVAAHAYAPYSNFPVGAALETDGGDVFLGTNMENASYGLSLCAEVGALQAALAGEKLDQIKRIAVVGGDMPTTPCGRCRQLISEASQLGKRDIEIWCADAELTIIESYKISELLPNAFGPNSIASETL